MLVALTIGTTVLAALPSTPACNTDTFVITVKGQYITLSVDLTAWNVNDGDPVAMSTSYYTDDTHEDNTFTADATGSSQAVDLKLEITSDGATWNCGTSVGADTYALYSSIDGGTSYLLGPIASGSATTIKTGLTTTQEFDLKFNSPSSTTTGTTQTITVTASAVAA